MSDRATLATGFLQAAGWDGARRAPLAGDASERSYERLTLAHSSAILMNSPPGQADDPADFVRMARYLSAQGLSAPDILAEDLATGFLLIEDFGDGLFAGLLHADPRQESVLYTLATDVLIHLARAPLPDNSPDLIAEDWARAAGFTLTFYAEPLAGPTNHAAFISALTAALHHHADGPRIFIHRDFHAENLILLPARNGLQRAGILDFQLGQAGQPGYDLVSLLQDARRVVTPTTQAAMTARYARALDLDPALFAARYATLGAQRALRIIGIFARLARHSSKPRYLAMIPHVWGHLQRNLAHPALADLRAACAALPPPTESALARLAKS
jgi:aminoglycoside/choline kinase family phosphotransferase